MNIKSTLSKLSSKNIVLIIIALVSLLMIITAVLNKGLYFTQFNEQEVVDVSKLSTDDVNKVLSFQNISRIDRENNLVYFEHDSYANVTSELGKDLKGKSYGVTKLFKTSPLPVLKNLALETLIILLTFTAFSYYFAFKTAKTKQANVAKVYLLLNGATLLACLFQLGFFALVSRIYQVKITDLYLILITLIFGTFIFAKAFLNIDPKEDTSIDKVVLKSIKKSFSLIKVIGLILAILTIGLGKNFVIPAVDIFIGLFMLNIATKYAFDFVFEQEIESTDEVQKSAQKSVAMAKKSTKLNKTPRFSKKKK